MSRRLSAILPVASALILGASALPLSSTDSESASAQPTKLFLDGKIHIGDGIGTVVEALLVRGGKIVELGANADFERRIASEGFDVIDLHGAWVVPGLQDSHGQLEAFGRMLEGFDISNAASYEELCERIAGEANTLERGAWIVGTSWNPNEWAELDEPHHALLSEMVPSHPVVCLSVDGTAALVNAKALAELDFDKTGVPRVRGGLVVVDEEGEPTGFFLDRAVDLIEKILPEVTREDRTRRILLAQENCLAVGLTCVHDMGIDLETIGIYRDLALDGRLRIRVVGYLEARDGLRADALEELPLASDAFDMFSVPGISLTLDGSLATRGAALIGRYADALGQRGRLQLTEGELRERLAVAVTHGLQPALSAVGDQANRMALDLYEEVSMVHPRFKEFRPRIEFATVVTPKDWPRFPALEILPSMMPVQTMSPLVLERLGTERAKGARAWRQVGPGVGGIAFGSGFPAVMPDPVAGLVAARRVIAADGDSAFLEDETLDGRGALFGFTLGPARAVHQESRRGRLSRGFFCDLTVLDVDPVGAELEELENARVLMTVVNGEVVYASRER